MRVRNSTLAAIFLFMALAGCGSEPTRQQARDELVVKFRPEVKAGQIDSMEARIGLEQVDDLPELHIKVYRVTSAKTVDQAIAACAQEPFVEYAEPNYDYDT